MDHPLLKYFWGEPCCTVHVCHMILTVSSSCLGIIMTASPLIERTFPCKLTRLPSHTSTISPGWRAAAPALLPLTNGERERNVYVHVHV